MMRRAAVVAVLSCLAAGAYAIKYHPSAVDAYIGPVKPYLPAFLMAETAKAPTKAKRSLAPAPVRIAAAVSKDVPIRLEGVGAVQARSTVAVKSRVDGQLFEAAVREGQLVKKGDLLFRLDPRPFEAQLKQAEANLARDRANLEKSRADAVRLKDLSSKGFTPKTRLEEAETSVQALTAAIDASRAAIDLAKLNLSYTTIKAPIDGRVGALLVSPGNMVKANDTQALLIITEVDPIYVAFAMPEQHIPEIKKRMASDTLSVTVVPQGDDGGPMKGELFFINNAVDTNTGTIQLLARFQNDGERLVPGQFVKASLTLDVLKNAVVVPERTVQVNQRGHYVYVVKDGKSVELRQVVLGPEAGSEVVIADGLKQGEVVVTDGQLRLFPGAQVAPSNGKGKNGKNGKAQS